METISVVQSREKFFTLRDRDLKEQITFTEISELDVPVDIAKHIQKEWKTDTEKDAENPERPRFEEVLTTQYGGIKTYVISCEGITATRNTYFVDEQGSEMAGFGALYVGVTDADAQITAGYTKTFNAEETSTGKDFTRAGLNIRRLILMNAYCLRRYQRPLHSSLAQYAYAEDAWMKLCDAGYAEEVPDAERELKSGKKQYRFKRI